jgi:hypothetical protein
MSDQEILLRCCGFLAESGHSVQLELHIMSVLVILGCRADGPSALAQFVVSGAAERTERALEAPGVGAGAT